MENTNPLYQEFRENLVPKFEWLASLSNDSNMKNPEFGAKYFNALQNAISRIEDHANTWEAKQEEASKKVKDLEKDRKALNFDKRNVEERKKAVDIEALDVRNNRIRLVQLDKKIKDVEEQEAWLEEGYEKAKTKHNEERRRILDQRASLKGMPGLVEKVTQMLGPLERMPKLIEEVAQMQGSLESLESMPQLIEKATEMQGPPESLGSLSELTEKVTQMLGSLELRFPIKESRKSSKEKGPELTAASGAASGAASDTASVATSVATQDRPLKRKQEHQGEQGPSRPHKAPWTYSPAQHHALTVALQPKSDWQLLCESLATNLQKFRPILDISCNQVSLDHVLQQLTTGVLTQDSNSAVHIEQFMETAEQGKWFCFLQICKRGHWSFLSQIPDDGVCSTHGSGIACFQVKKPEMTSTVTNLVCRF